MQQLELFPRASASSGSIPNGTCAGSTECACSPICSADAGFRSLAEDIDTTTPTGRLIFHVFGSIAEFERERIVERTKEGLAAARRRGRKGGRPPALSEDAKAEIRRMRDENHRPIAEIARAFSVSRSTIYRM